MIRYDSLLGTYHGSVVVHERTLTIDGLVITLLQERDAQKLPWRDLGIDYVVDATGHYTDAQNAREHITSGAQKVIITAPAHGEDITIVMGVNTTQYNANQHAIISLGSCTTNAVVPLLEVIKDHTPIVSTMVSTVHAYTNTQHLLDVDAHARDPRTSRAAACNIIPTSTGAATSVTAVLPEFKESLCAQALRVPVPIVSLADVTVLLERAVTRDELHGWYQDAAATSLKNILEVSPEKLVSGDFKGNRHSVILDAPMTMVCGKLVRVYGWYDNEWGYSNRIKDFLNFISTR
ncbi:unnamed protein product [Sphagnum balticum]